MPLYYFGLDQAAAPPDQEGEHLPNDQEARKLAELIAEDLERNNGSRQVTIVVFDAGRKRIA
jgi:hypothetical protein